jgi:hypothetical protein
MGIQGIHTEFSWVIVLEIIWKKGKKMGDNIKMDLKQTGCEDGREMELAQDCVQWQAIVLAMLNVLFLLLQCCYLCPTSPAEDAYPGASA